MGLSYVDGYKNPPSPDLTLARGYKHPSLRLLAFIPFRFVIFPSFF
jgi:hypothetical protein